MRLKIIRRLLLFFSCAFFYSCGQNTERPAGTLQLRVWCHQGQEAENAAIRAIAAAFNAAHSEQKLAAAITFFPDNQYSEKVSAAAAAGC